MCSIIMSVFIYVTYNVHDAKSFKTQRILPKVQTLVGSMWHRGHEGGKSVFWRVLIIITKKHGGNSEDNYKVVLDVWSFFVLCLFIFKKSAKNSWNYFVYFRGAK